MSMKSYAQTVSGLNRKADGSWLKLFCENEVHMCGFSFYAEELVMWEALKQRLDYIRENDVFKELGNRLYIYLPYTDADKSQKEQLADVLKTYSAEPVLIPVGDDDFANAWMSLYGRMSLRLRNLRMTKGDSEVLGHFRYPQFDTRNRNVRAAYCPALYYPHCCKFGVPMDKPEVNIWLFYCEVHGKITRWMGQMIEMTSNLSSLEPIIREKKKSDSILYTCFYLDYTTGDLFAVKENEKELSFVCKLIEIRNAHDFDSLIYPPLSQD